MEEEACLVVYCPSGGGWKPSLVLSPDILGAKTRTEPDNERLSFVSKSCAPSAVTDFRSKIVTPLSSSAAAPDAYVSQPLSTRHAVCLAGVEGMVCHSCVQLIETTISKERGVHGIRVSLQGKEAMVEFDPTQTTPQALVSAIDDMGFEARHISTHTSEALGISVSVPFRNETGAGMGMERAVVGIEGMVCQSCVSNISSNLGKMEGVKNISVSLTDKNASITYDRGLLSVEQLCGAIEELGFGASCEEMAAGAGEEEGEGVKKCFVRIEGMTCHSCVGLIESVVGDLGGVVSVTVTLATKEGVVEYREGQVGTEEIRSAIEDTGFDVVAISATSSDLPPPPATATVVGSAASTVVVDSVLSSDSEGADSDNPLLSPDEQGLTQSKKKRKKRSGKQQLLPSVQFRKSSPARGGGSEVVVLSDGSDSTKKKAVVKVTGMSCSSCVAKIERHLGKMDGIHSVLVALLSEKADVQYAADRISPDRIVAEIQALGFGAQLISETDIYQEGKLDLAITGMTCSSCVHLIERTLTQTPGIERAVVTLATGRGRVDFDPSVIGPRDIIKLVEDAGFEAKSVAKSLVQTDLNNSSTIRRWRWTFIVTAVFAVPAVLLAFIPSGVHWTIVIRGVTIRDILLFLISTFVQIVGGRQFYVSGYKSVRHGAANMDVLIALGTTIAYVYSVCALFTAAVITHSPTKTFFETPPMLLAFVSLGRYLEHIAKGKTSEALAKLVSLQATEARLITTQEKDGERYSLRLHHWARATTHYDIMRNN
jgi:Cu+-exporting ATPase